MINIFCDALQLYIICAHLTLITCTEQSLIASFPVNKLVNVMSADVLKQIVGGGSQAGLDMQTRLTLVNTEQIRKYFTAL